MVVSVSASIATFGIGAVVAFAVIGACVGVVCAVASTAMGHIVSGKASSLETYAKNALQAPYAELFLDYWDYLKV